MENTGLESVRIEALVKERIAVLAEYLGCDADDISEARYPDNCFEVGDQEYLVLTDDEADEAVKESIERDLWAFNAEFIASHTRNGLSQRAIEALKKMQGELCEDAQPLIEALIEDMDAFVSDATSSDGRGHFLAGYDGEEHEAGDYYIYRIN